MRILVRYLLTEILHIRIKPSTIQMPITGRCNSKCSTCNIWKQEKKEDIDLEQLAAVLKDPFLQKIENVGVNGGEPFLHHDFIGLINTLMNLPKIKRIYLITNGLLTNRVLRLLSEAHEVCKKNNVEIYLTISFDGINEIYTDVRGIKDGYKKVYETITLIKKDIDKYCETLTLGTTISKKNIEYISEIKMVAEKLELPINYHLAVLNRRIYTNDSYDEYSVLCDERSLALTTEFFWGLFKYSPRLKQKILYFQNYYYLAHKGKDRISACEYKYQDITIDENLNVYYCAKESMELGIANQPIKKLLTDRKSIKELKRIRKTCKECGHYITIPTIRGTILFLAEMLKPMCWIKYKVLCKITR